MGLLSSYSPFRVWVISLSLSLSLSHTHTHTHLYPPTHRHTHTHTHARTHARTHAHIHTHAPTHPHTHTHTHRDLHPPPTHTPHWPSRQRHERHEYLIWRCGWNSSQQANRESRYELFYPPIKLQLRRDGSYELQQVSILYTKSNSPIVRFFQLFKVVV